MNSGAIVRLSDCNIYQQKNLILSDVSFEIMPGEFVYLIGKTGSGKSSLLRTLYADLDTKTIDAQIVGFDLQKLKKKDIPQLRRKLGIVFQDFQLLSDRSVMENLFFVMRATGWNKKQDMQTRAQELLEKVGLATKGFKMPHELSGGEQQRVAIARALINHPVLIIADEPTGNLDPETTDGIMRLLMEISTNGCAVLMATHDVEMMRKFPSRTLRCEGGHVMEAIPLAEMRS